jgi:DNA-binding MarR family transcriptional regulator
MLIRNNDAPSEGLLMGWVMEMLQQVPLSAVLKERVQLIQEKCDKLSSENDALKQKVSALEREMSLLIAQLPNKPDGSLDPDTARVLVHLFRAEGDERDVGVTANMLGMEKGVVKYHLDRLKDAGFAVSAGGNYLHHHAYWALTPSGRRHVIEKKLI